MISTLSDALAERGYDTLTPVQEAVTAPGLETSDLLVSAQTGSGKTVGFGLAIAPTLLAGEDRFGPAGTPLALVVAPTRELASQVMRELGWLYARAGAAVVSCIGGMDAREERRALERGAHVVVGTPGRLRDHIQRGSLDLGAVRAIVLDEADEMLDLGFREDLEFMLAAAPDTRRTLLFSATVPPAIATLAKTFQRDAVRVTTLTGTSQHADIAYQALRVGPHDAENAIINVLRFHEAQTAIVFANTRAAVNRLAARLGNRGLSIVTLSGELSQAERSHALQAMRDGRARVCVATDVAARGIDLPNLELVIHAELPAGADALLHRSGRTGRAGRKGVSALIVPPKAAKKAERLLKFAKIEAEWRTAPSAEDVLARDEERLLSDPAWDAPATGEEGDFATRLLAERTPAQIAAAYLRLYRARHSAPEDLAPAEEAAPRERAPFGPAAWFALSVGRDDRAEARWLLPLLCRAGGLDKDAIGAIRVQATETCVEIAAARAAGFLAKLGDGRMLEDGVTVRPLDGPPGATAAAAPPDRRPAASLAPEPGDASRPNPASGQDHRPRKPARRTEAGAGAKPDASRSTFARSGGGGGGGGASAAEAPRRDARPPKPDASRKQPGGKGGERRKDGAKSPPPRSEAGRSERPRSDGKPPVKARAEQRAGKPSPYRADATDTSKRMSRPGKPGKPGPKGRGAEPKRGDGRATPRRPKG